MAETDGKKCTTGLKSAMGPIPDEAFTGDVRSTEDPLARCGKDAKKAFDQRIERLRGMPGR